MKARKNPFLHAGGITAKYPCTHYKAFSTLVVAIVSAGLTDSIRAQDISKASNSTALDLTGSWTGGVVPTSSNTAVYNTASGVTNTLGTGLSVSGIRADSGLGGNVAITGAYNGSTAFAWNNTTDLVTLSAHGLSNGQAIYISGGTAPAGLALNTPYYLVNVTADTFQLSTSVGGSAVNFTSDGTTVALRGGGGSLTLGSGGINTSSAPAARTFTIAGNTVLSTSQTWTTGGSTDAVQITQTGIISGTGALTIAGSGNGAFVSLNAPSTFSGGLILNSGGAVKMGSASIASGGLVTSGATGTGNITINGGKIFGGVDVAASTITINGDFAVNSGTDSDNARLGLGGAIELGNATRTVSLGRSGTATAVAGGGASFRLSQVTNGPAISVSNGTLKFTADQFTVDNSQYVGLALQSGSNFTNNSGLTIGNRVITVTGTGSHFGTGSNSPTLTVESGGIFNTSDGGANTRNTSLAGLNGAGVVTNLDTDGATSGGNNSTITVGNNNTSGSFSGRILNGQAANTVLSLGMTVAADSIVSLTKTGTGTQTLSGANNYTGATTLSVGTLIFANTAAKASGTTVTAAAGTTVGLGVGGSGFFTSSDVDSLLSGSLSGFSLNATTSVGVDTSAGDFTHATNQTGSRPLAKLGANALTLSGNNSFTGNTTISAGTIKVGSVNALGANSSSVTVNAGTVLDLNGTTMTATNALALNGTGISNGGSLVNSSATAGTYAGVVTISPGASIGGSGSFTLSGGIAATASTNNLIKVGAGTVTLSAAATTNRSTVNATTQIDAGVLRIQNASALATGTTAVTTINGGVLELNGGITLDQPISANNGATLRSDGTNASNGKITVSNAVGANAVTLSTVSSGNVFTVGNGANDISGGNGSDDTITVSGPGTVVLGSASDYVGNWSFDGGTTQIGAAAALGATPASTITLNGGALNGRLAATTVFTANPITVSSNSSLNADRSTNGGSVNYTFGALSIGSQTLSTTSTAAVTSGTGGVIVGATNLTGNATFKITNGATATTQLTVGAITDNGNQLTLTGSGNFAQSAAWASGTAGSLRLGISGGTTYSGTATLNQANTFTGGVTVNNGATLRVGVSSTFASSAVATGATGTGAVTLNDGATLVGGGFTLGASQFNINGNVTIGNSIPTSGRLTTNAATYNLGGTAASNGSSGTVRTLSLFGSQLATAITGATSGANQFTIEGQTNGYATNTISNGTLRFIAAGNVAAGSLSGVQLGAMAFTGNTGLTIGDKVYTVITNGTPFATATAPRLTIESGGYFNAASGSNSGRIINVFSLSGAGVYTNLTSGTTSLNSALTINGTDTATFSGTIANGSSYSSVFTGAPTIVGTVSLTKAGTGTQILSGTNTYSGTTTISGGTLVINGDHSGATAAVSVGGNGSSGTPTLAGSGTIGGATIIAAAGSGVVGTHSPGVAGVSNGVGTQTFSNTLGYGTGSIFEWSLQAASTSDPGAVSNASTGTYDKVVAGGAVTGTGAVFKIVLGGNAFTDAFWNTDKTWTDIFSGAGAPSNLASIFTSFSGTNVNTDGTVIGRPDRQFTFNGTSTLTWSAVPEPTSALAGLLIAAGLMRRRRNA